MSRLLLLVAIAIVVYLLIKSFRRRLDNENASAKSAKDKVEDMVRCSYCGTHLPKTECVVHADKYYCTEAHKRAHLDQPK